jgi:ubiquitin carboxyl-terminal hydrolase MINDY-1/2
MTLNKSTSQITCNLLTLNLADTLFNVFVPRWTKNRAELPMRQRDDASSMSTLNLERNIDDALALFDKLKMGLDVNVKFATCREFEYTRELDIFDLFQIGLYHGWLIDPQQVMYYKNFFNKSYNQLVELTFYKDNKKEEEKKEEEEEEDTSLIGLLAENFLESSASQLTYFGLSELHASVAPNELCVLFRNNHFSTMYKHAASGKLYLLVTDQGYLTHENIVWETLDNIEGDAVFCDSSFRQVSPVRGGDEVGFENIDKNEALGSSSDACQSDYLLALSLQEMDNEEARSAAVANNADIKQKQQQQQSQSQASNANARRVDPTPASQGAGADSTSDRKKEKKDKSTVSFFYFNFSSFIVFIRL